MLQLSGRLYKQFRGAAFSTVGTAFGNRFAEFGKLFEAAFDNNFGKRLWGTAVEKLWGTILVSR